LSRTVAWAAITIMPQKLWHMSGREMWHIRALLVQDSAHADPNDKMQ